MSAVFRALGNRAGIAQHGMHGKRIVKEISTEWIDVKPGDGHAHSPIASVAVRRSSSR